MFCNNCGQEIDDNAVVCPHCGVATDKMTDVTGEAPAEAKKKVNICAILGFVFSLIGIIVEFALSTLGGLAVIIAGFVLSIVGVVLAKKKNLNLKGLGIAGIVISAIGIVLFILLITVLAALIAGIAGMG